MLQVQAVKNLSSKNYWCIYVNIQFNLTGRI